MHHILFLEWSAIHNFSVLNTSFFIIFIIFILSSKLDVTTKYSNNKKSILIASIILSILLSIWVYKNKFTCGYTEKYYEVGKFIKTQSRNDETIFVISKPRINMQILYYSKRNILDVSNKKEAKKWLKMHKRDKGIIFFIDEYYKVNKFKRIEV